MNLSWTHKAKEQRETLECFREKKETPLKRVRQGSNKTMCESLDDYCLVIGLGSSESSRVRATATDDLGYPRQVKIEEAHFSQNPSIEILVVVGSCRSTSLQSGHGWTT